MFEPWDDIENLALNQNRKAWKQEGAGLLGDSGLRSPPKVGSRKKGRG